MAPCVSTGDKDIHFAQVSEFLKQTEFVMAPCILTDDKDIHLAQVSEFQKQTEVCNGSMCFNG